MTMKKCKTVLICFVCSVTLLAGSTGCGSKNPESANSTNTTANSSNNASTTDNSSNNTVSTDENGTHASGTIEPIDLKIGNAVFMSAKDRKSTKVAWTPTLYEKKVKPYAVNSDLSNIANLAQFGNLTQSQKGMLSKYSFMVTPSKEEQLYYIYENNQYLKIPSFITTDSVLQMYHIFFDYSLRTLEYDKLLGALEQLNNQMLAKSIYVYDKLKNPDVKRAALKNIAYYAVAQMALEKGISSSIPAEAKKMAAEEYKKVSAQSGFENSAIFPFKLDYSQYKPRGHYTRNPDFERFFKAMMWYGQAPFPIPEKKGLAEKNKEQIIQAQLIAYTLFLTTNDTPDIELWEKIYDPTVFYVGSADDLDIYQISDLIVKVYGPKPDIETFASKENLESICFEAEKLPQPLIQAKWSTVDTPVCKQFRFMGQRYIPDSEILQNLVEPILRRMPKGLDVMGVLGSERAYDLLINKYKESEKWPKYPTKFAEMKDKFSKVTGEKWRSNMYYGWLWVLKSFITPYGDGYPSFMRNTAWTDKSLNTALGSWAELRHDTILYGKQSGAECGGGEEEAPPVVKGYVEPNIEAYDKLLWLTKYSRLNLTERNILNVDLESRMQYFEDLLQFLINCSVKELKNEELSKEEYDRLLIYGGELESITLSLADGKIISDTDRNMAVVADVHTVPGTYLEEGVGQASEIYVVVPIAGKLYLTRGSVFSYYEFVSGTRLTDEEWQTMLKELKQPHQPDWMDSFLLPLEKERIPEPEKPYKGGPYSSGC